MGGVPVTGPSPAARHGARLVRAALVVLTRWGAGDETPDDWRGDICRCLHKRDQHYPTCMKCGCAGFRLKARQR